MKVMKWAQWTKWISIKWCSAVGYSWRYSHSTLSTQFIYLKASNFSINSGNGERETNGMERDELIERNACATIQKSMNFNQSTKWKSANAASECSWVMKWNMRQQEKEWNVICGMKWSKLMEWISRAGRQLRFVHYHSLLFLPLSLHSI